MGTLDQDIKEKQDRIAWAEGELATLEADLLKVERRINELEPPVEFNLEDTVIQVKLTEAGEQVVRDVSMTPTRLADGYTEFYLTTFIKLFGRHVVLGNPTYKGKARVSARNFNDKHPEDFRSSSELRMLRGNIYRGIADMKRTIAGCQDGIEYFQELKNQK